MLLLNDVWPAMLDYDAASGWLSPARRCASPNFDQRPADVVPSLLVVHGISLPPQQFGGPYIDQLFCNQLQAREHPYFADIAQLRVSAHVLIRRDGELVQYVPLHQRAWHAGVSSFEGCADCNSYSVGVELEGCDQLPYEDVQYRQLAAVYHCVAQHFPSLCPERVTGHSDIAPGRKTDPGPAFDWQKLAHLIGPTQPS